MYDDTLQKEEYIRSLGYEVVGVWECEWRTKCREDPQIAEDARIYKESEFGKRGETFTEDQMIDRIVSGELFGFVECDIVVPEELGQMFEEMCPVFKNIRLCRDDLSDHMRDYAMETGRLSQPQRTLVGSKSGEKILLATALLKWYLEHGMKVTKIYKTFEYVPAKCFEKFGQSVSDARRAGDSDPNLTLLAETSKLVGNSLYGKTITNKEKHKKTMYCLGTRDTSRKIRQKRFSSMEEIEEDFYEIEEDKMRVGVLNLLISTFLLSLLSVCDHNFVKVSVFFCSQVKMDVPVTLGFTILQLAKLRMLQFYYDRLDR